MKLARHNDDAEIFHSLQGEGPRAGTPSVFVRCSLCNLYCRWCDTDYTWNWQGTPFVHRGSRKYDQQSELIELDPAQVATRVRRFDCTNLVLTGGEPLLQQLDLLRLLELLEAGRDYFVEVETSGSIEPKPAFSARVDQFNVSPKLTNSGVPAERRLKPTALEAFAAMPSAVFKFVVEEPEDLAEVVGLCRDFGIAPKRCYLMPQGTISAEVARRRRWLVTACLDHGFGFSDRLHIHAFGAARGT